MNIKLGALLLSLAMLAAPSTRVMAAGDGQVHMTAVTATHSGGGTELRMQLERPIDKAPPIFTMGNPNRIVFDIPGVINATGAVIHDIQRDGVTSVQLIQMPDATRVAVSMGIAASARLTVQGDDLVLQIGAAPATASFPAARTVISNIDFRRGPSGAGRVLVDLGNPQTIVEIAQQANILQLDFRNADVADDLLRRLNVEDFGTPVKNVTLVRLGADTRMLIETTGAGWNYNAFQTDTRYVMEIRPGHGNSTTSTHLGGAAGYKGERMSLNFQNVDVRNLFSVLADFTKMNFVTSDAVQGAMTLRLQDVPWDQALEIILQARGLDMRKTGNVIWIAPADEMAKREKDRLEVVAKSATLEPLTTESFQLNYASVSEVVKLLTGGTGQANAATRIISSRGSAMADYRTNQLFVTDAPSRLEEIGKIIKKIDVPVKQVMIEARIVEAGDKFSRSLGARLAFTQQETSRLAGGPTRWGNSLGQSSLPAPLLDSGTAPSQFQVSLLSGAGSKLLTLELSALEADGRGKIVSSPSVVTADKEQAIIEQGTELPYLESSANGATSVTFKKANLRLVVTPQITPDGNVMMAVEINKDAPGTSTIAGYAIDTKHVKTKVLVDDGGTVVIGGIFTQEERSDVNKVPVLGDVPVLGNAFKNSVMKDNKTELLVFLTPRILDSRTTGAAASK